MALVVVSCALPGDALSLLRSEHEVVVVETTGESPNRLLPAIPEANGLVSMLTDRVTKELIDAAPELVVIGNCAVGYDNVDIEAAQGRGITVVNTPNVLTDATADFAWALMLAAARRVTEGDRFVRAGRFHGWELGLLLGREVSNTTLGILGLGRIGRAVATRARGFGMNILYSQRHRAAAEVEAETGARHVPLDALLGESDFVSVHVPLTSTTRHLLDERALRSMKPSSVLVNTSRGAVIDEASLAKALREGWIAAAGLDVFEREPEIHPEFLDLDNVVLAPHVASATEATRARMARCVAEDVLRVLRGERPEQRVV
jgi:glyoxylate reductase